MSIVAKHSEHSWHRPWPLGTRHWFAVKAAFSFSSWQTLQSFVIKIATFNIFLVQTYQARVGLP
jgi:hypothetical protein